MSLDNLTVENLDDAGMHCVTTQVSPWSTDFGSEGRMRRQAGPELSVLFFPWSSFSFRICLRYSQSSAEARVGAGLKKAVLQHRLHEVRDLSLVL